MTKIQLTWAQADVVEAALTKHFSIKALAALGDKMAMNKTHSSMQSFFDVASWIANKALTGKGLNLVNNPGKALTAVEMFNLLGMTDFSEQEVDAIIDCGIIKVAKGVMKN